MALLTRFKPLLAAEPATVAEMHSAAMSHCASSGGGDKWPSRSWAARLSSAVEGSNDSARYAQSCVTWACQCSSWSGVAANRAALCTAAKEAARAFTRDAPRLLRLYDHVQDAAPALAAHDVSLRLFVQPEDADSSAAALAMARRRCAGRGTTPLSQVHAELSAVVSDGVAVLERLAAYREGAAPPPFADMAEGPPGLSARLSQHQQALRLLQEAPSLYEEKQAHAALVEAQHTNEVAAKSAAAAVALVAEERRRRRAEEARLAVASRCADAVGALHRAVEHAESSAAARARLHIDEPDGGVVTALQTPRAMSQCRNADNAEPITLEPLEHYGLEELCVLPSGNCMLRTNLVRHTALCPLNVPLTVCAHTSYRCRDRRINRVSFYVYIAVMWGATGKNAKAD